MNRRSAASRMRSRVSPERASAIILSYDSYVRLNHRENKNALQAFLTGSPEQLLHGPPPNEIDDLLRRNRAAEQVALPHIAANVLQVLQLFLGLDTFRHHLEAEAVRQADGRIADDRSISALTDLLDKGTVE